MAGLASFSREYGRRYEKSTKFPKNPDISPKNQIIPRIIPQNLKNLANLLGGLQLRGSTTKGYSKNIRGSILALPSLAIPVRYSYSSLCHTLGCDWIFGPFVNRFLAFRKEMLS